MTHMDISTVTQAATRIAPFLAPTPVLENAALNERVGCRVLLKAELLNVTGSFKIRGALNALLEIQARRAGSESHQQEIVALSSGNHAQAIAQAARWLNMQATIVMPHDAPELKLARTRALGASVKLYQRPQEDREKIAAALVEELGATLVHPFNQPAIIAGQGTAGLELVAFAKAQNIKLGLVAAPCSGGGLLAGVGTAVRASFADADVVAVEPEPYNDYEKSFAAGYPVRLTQFPPNLCDSLQVDQPGSLTFSINQTLGARAVTVTDDEVLRAMHFGLVELKLCLEPGGAAALAALLSNKLGNKLGNTADSTAVNGADAIAVILSGGNVDPSLVQRALSIDL